MTACLVSSAMRRAATSRPRAEQVIGHLHRGRLHPEGGEQVCSARADAREDHHGLTRADLPRAQPDAADPIVAHLDGDDVTFDDGYSARHQLLPFVGTRLRCGVQEQGDVSTPLPEQLRLVHSEGTGGQDPYGLVAHLPAVTVGTMHNVAAPALTKSWYVGSSSSARRPPTVAGCPAWVRRQA